MLLLKSKFIVIQNHTLKNYKVEWQCFSLWDICHEREKLLIFTNTYVSAFILRWNVFYTLLYKLMKNIVMQMEYSKELDS